MRKFAFSIIAAGLFLTTNATGQTNIDPIRDHAWGENVGWINVGNGAGPYANTNNTDFGINLSLNGVLSGYAWGENVGWINFSGGALASPANPAMIDCTGHFAGYAWSENTGWLSLTTASGFVALDSATSPYACDVNHDGKANGLDVQVFINLILNGGSNWRDLCSGDVGSPANGSIGLEDLSAFANCLVS